ncbi:MAG: AMP-binding protein [Clostridia bacterium]|nr:AMP-binding protein [Clostridia bacterium]
MLISKFCETDFSSYEDFKARFEIRVPENFNFAYDVMDELAATKPDARALVWCDDKGEEVTLTFGDMKRLSDKAASMFASYGIAKGDVVMTLLRSKYQYWICALALHKLGAVLVPATHQLVEKDLKYRFNAAGVKAVVAVGDARLLAAIDNVKAETPTLKHRFVVGAASEGWIDFDAAMEAASAEFVRPTGNAATTNDDLMLMYFTSGTTGMPKMVVHDFRYPLGHILTAKFWQNLQPGDLHFTHADTGWAKTSWGKIYGQWISEAAIFVYDYENKFKPTDLLHVIEKHKVTVFCAPPTVFRFLIKADIENYDLSSLRHCCIAGEPLNAEVYNKWKEITGLELREGFGQTETAVLIANFPWIAAKPGSTGRPSPHFNVKLIDENGEEVEPGDEGEICIDISNGRPAGLTCGYYKNPEKTAEIMYDGWYHTGDMAWMDEDGYLWFVGRADDVIKSSGYRIGPFEVESALVEHPAVLEAAITAVPDPERGQIVKATVVLVKGYTASDALKKELQDHVKRTTAPYKYPRIVEFVDEIPKTFSGKIKRAEIRKNDGK